MLRASDADLSGSGDEPVPAQCPRAPHPPATGPLPVRFMTADLRPSPDAQDMVSFGAMEGACYVPVSSLGEGRSRNRIKMVLCVCVSSEAQ